MTRDQNQKKNINIEDKKNLIDRSTQLMNKK